jgi:hypothetical protein
VSTDWPPEHRDTCVRLASLEQGRFQQLGDALLPAVDASLAALRSYGVTTEGKTRKGVPDSFLGPEASQATTAIEYTTQATRLQEKFALDVKGVLKNCPNAKRLYLVTNRSVDEVDVAALEALAHPTGLSLVVVGGLQIAKWLDLHRQDIRQQFLAVPIGVHTQASIVATLAHCIADAALLEQMPSFVINRAEVDAAVADRIERSRRWIAVVGEAGLGKSVWSLDFARREGATRPALWIRASDICWTDMDPLSMEFTRAAHGVADPTLCTADAELLRRTGFRALIVIDAIEEVGDLGALLRSLRRFRTSALMESASVVLTCRTVAFESMSADLRTTLPELFEVSNQPNVVRLPPLCEHGATEFLTQIGLSTLDARSLAVALPYRQRTNPFFLTRAAKNGPPFDGAGGRITETSEQEIQRWLGSATGSAPALDLLRRALEEVAWEALWSDAEDVEIARLPEFSSLFSTAGHNSLLVRAGHAGLLRQRVARVAFTHALFLEHYASRRLARTTVDEVEQRLRSTRRLRARALFARLANSGSGTPNPALLAAVGRADSALAMELTLGATADVIFESAAATAALETALRSRYWSHVENALRHCARLADRRAAELVLRWVDELSPAKLQRFDHQVAQVLLAANVVDNFSLISKHRVVKLAPWLEPSDVADFQRLSPEARHDLASSASEGLEGAAAEERQARLSLLSILKSSEADEYLARQAAVRPLDDVEHRLLVFANSDASMAAYAASIERHVEACAASSDPSKAWYSARNQILLINEDVRYFPHDQLIAFVGRLLGHGHRWHSSLGREWARLLRSIDLVEPMFDSPTAPPDSMSSGLEQLLKAVRPSEVVRRFKLATSPSVRRAFVRGMQWCPAEITEATLAEAAQDPVLRRDAINSLAQLQSTRATSLIADQLRAPSSAERTRALHWVELSQHQTFAEMLVELLDRATAAHLSSNDDTERGENRNEEYLVLRAMGAVGGARSCAAVTERWERLHHKEAALQVLLKENSSAAQDDARRRLEPLPNRGEMLCKALQLSFIRWHSPRARPRIPRVDEPALVTWVLEALRSKDEDAWFEGLQIASICSGDTATEFLRTLALRPEEHVRHQALRCLHKRGDAAAAGALAESILDRAEKLDWPAELCVRELDALTHPVVRAAVRHRLQRTVHVRWVWVLGFYAEPVDETIFAQLKEHADDEIAGAAEFCLSRSSELD